MYKQAYDMAGHILQSIDLGYTHIMYYLLVLVPHIYPKPHLINGIWTSLYCRYDKAIMLLRQK